MRIKYNAPTTLTYAFFCTLIVTLDQFFIHGLTRAFFTVPNALAFDLLKPINYIRLFTHIAGHADWNHLLGNMAYVLLLGPMLEETYGSLTMLLMMVVTGFVTGVLNACFFPHPLLGASGIVFMMILLASFTNSGKDEIPLTFILIVIFYLGREVINAFRGDDISQFAHLAGGFCGSLFGFFQPTARSGRIRRIQQTAAPAKASVRTGASLSAKNPTPTRTGTAATAKNPTPVRTGTAASTGSAAESVKKTLAQEVPSAAAGTRASSGKRATMKLPESKSAVTKPRNR